METLAWGASAFRHTCSFLGGKINRPCSDCPGRLPRVHSQGWCKDRRQTPTHASRLTSRVTFDGTAFRHLPSLPHLTVSSSFPSIDFQLLFQDGHCRNTVRLSESGLVSEGTVRPGAGSRQTQGWHPRLSHRVKSVSPPNGKAALSLTDTQGRRESPGNEVPIRH